MKGINENLELSSEGLKMLKQFEGLGDGNDTTPELEPYVCDNGYWTIGYGHLLRIKGERMHFNTWSVKDINEVFSPLDSEEEAMYILLNDIKRCEGHVINSINVPLSQCMFDALVIFAFNCWYSETIWSMVNNTKPKHLIAFWWSRHWITCNRQINKGLLSRRIQEAFLFMGYGYKY